MKLIIHLLLLSSLSILIIAEETDDIKKAMEEMIKKTNGTALNGIMFHVGGYLGKGQHSFVWKGDYNKLNVAYKLTKLKDTYKTEIEAFEALNAVNNSEVENHGIPNVYVHGGEILSGYWGIGMTLLEENLEERWKQQNKKISELSILLIFKRGVKILEYLNEMEVLHNDIKPSNIFLRGSEVFFGDFNSARRHGRDLPGSRSFTRRFASSGLHSKKKRTPMDDLESLVFSLWSVAGIECDNGKWYETQRQPEGKTLAECKKIGKAESKMTTKCNGFKNKHVRKACQLIAADEMLKDQPAPDYKRMEDILDEAIENVDKSNSGTPQFEWLTGQSSQRVMAMGESSKK